MAAKDEDFEADPADDDAPDPDQLDEAQLEAEVRCPYCGESSVIGLDPAGGPNQEYVEDCQVCCRPWLVRVQYDGIGTAEVWVSESD